MAGQPRVALAWLIGDAIIAVLHVLNLTLVTWLYRPLALLDLDYEANLPTWYSSLKLGAIGFLLLVVAWRLLRRKTPRAWAMVLPAGLALYLSLDELAQLHERLSVLHTEVLPYSGAWMVIALPMGVVGVLLSAALPRGLWGPPGISARLLAGACLYLLSAGVLEIAHNFVAPSSPAHLILIFIEEMGELLAASLVLWGLHDLLAAHGIRLICDDSPRRLPAQSAAAAEPSTGGHLPRR